jgi:hypothetical protein
MSDIESDKPQENKVKSTDNKLEEPINYAKYMTYAVIACVIIYLLYIGYNKFYYNTQESYINIQPRTDPQADIKPTSPFDMDIEIKKLITSQEKYLQAVAI